jgi:hypothetical protein
MSESIRASVRARLAPALAVPLTIATGLAARAWLSGLAAKVAGDALYPSHAEAWRASFRATARRTMSARARERV